MKYLSRNKIIIVLIILLLVLFPSTISLPQQSRSENIVTAMGIDKLEDGYEVSIQYVIPYASGAQSSLKVSSSKGSTVAEAVENLNEEFGKISGFAHCRAIIFNDKACEDNLTNVLDYLIRIKTNTNNIGLLNTKNSAKDVLNCVQNLDNEFYTVINSNGTANDQRRYQNLKSIGDYYDKYFSDNKFIDINSIGIEQANMPMNSSPQEQSGGGGSSSGGNSNDESGGTQSSSSQTSKKISNKGDLVILSSGKLLSRLDEKQSDNLNWFNEKVEDMKLQIKNFSDDLFSNADLGYDVYSKDVSRKAYFEGNQPIFEVNMKVQMRFIEVIEEGINKDPYLIARKKFSQKLKNALSQEIENRMRSAEEHFKQNNYDVVKCYECFYKFQTKKFKKFLEDNGGFDISKIQFRYNIEVLQHI